MYASSTFVSYPLTDAGVIARRLNLHFTELQVFLCDRHPVLAVTVALSYHQFNVLQENWNWGNANSIFSIWIGCLRLHLTVDGVNVAIWRYGLSTPNSLCILLFAGSHWQKLLYLGITPLDRRSKKLRLRRVAVTDVEGGVSRLRRSWARLVKNVKSIISSQAIYLAKLKIVGYLTHFC